MRYRCGAGSLERAEERVFLRRVEVVAVPPAAAQRLEQRHGVGEAIGLRLDARDPRLQVGLLCIENQEVVDLAELQAPACEVCSKVARAATSRWNSVPP